MSVNGAASIDPGLLDEMKKAFGVGTQTKKNDEWRDRYHALIKETLELRRRVQSGHYFTDEELKMHDAAVCREARIVAKQDILQNMHKEMDAEYLRQMDVFEKETQAFWDKCKEEFKSGDEEENFFAWCRCMWAIPIAVLVRKFHWSPITEESCCDKRQALVKFCIECMDMADGLRKDQTKDVRTLCREIADECGASFVITEEEG